MSKGCDYCQNYKNIIYFNDLDDKGRGVELTMGVSEDGWYFEPNTHSDKKDKWIVTDNPHAKNINETPLNYCPVCGIKFN